MVRVNVSQISTASIPPTIKYQALAQMMDGVHRQTQLVLVHLVRRLFNTFSLYFCAPNSCAEQALHEAHELMNDCGLQAIQLMAPSPT
jgi:hypothetical protein